MRERRVVVVTETQAQEIADRTGTHITSVMRRLLGWPVRRSAGRRIDEALAASGWVGDVAVAAAPTEASER